MGPGVLPYPTGTRIGALSSVGRERLPYKQEVAGSNPAAPIEAPKGLPSECHERYPLQPLHPCEDSIGDASGLDRFALQRLWSSRPPRPELGLDEELLREYVGVYRLV